MKVTRTKRVSIVDQIIAAAIWSTPATISSLGKRAKGEDNPNAIALVWASQTLFFDSGCVIINMSSFPTAQQIVKFEGRSKRH